MISRPHFQHLVERVRLLPPLPAAFVYPCSADALQFALSGAFAGYLAPVLVGPEARIRDIANRAGIDISRLPIVDTIDEPRTAGIRAVGLARDGKVKALVKGSLGNDDLLAPVAAPESGLRGEHRLSHACFLDLPGMSHGILLADALLNITPNLAAKKDIVVNTIEFAMALGVAAPNVALLAAMDVESPAFPSTRDAVALKAMAALGMFRGAIVDGPLTADSALSAEAARANGIKSEVAGRPDILIAPTMEAASLVLRTLTGLTGGLAAGLVLGARLPIVAPAHTDSMEVKMASCVLASVLVSAVEDIAEREGKVAASSRLADAAA
ncbi:MAG: bifunctional enoyl-CoA hydratase/phosphate acetyltransferase, partial [Aromatoleum sp.]|nr:bifunctional enoyl-CoA hydratase/phosphate acetyltransferase [Aromatoleum sp.]